MINTAIKIQLGEATGKDVTFSITESVDLIPDGAKICYLATASMQRTVHYTESSSQVVVHYIGEVQQING